MKKGAGTTTGASPHIVAPAMSSPDDFSNFIEYDEDSVSIDGSHLSYNNLSLPAEPLPKSFDPQVLNATTTNPLLLTPNEIGAAESPDSLNDSSRDSSSESDGSFKASRKSTHTNADTTMSDNPDPAADGNYQPWGGLPSDDNTYNMFGSYMASPDHDHMTDKDMAFADTENVELNVDNFFDLDRAATTSPKAGTDGEPTTSSPVVPTFKANGASAPASHASRQRSPMGSMKSRGSINNRKKKKASVSLAQPMNSLKMSGSREVSPLAQHNPSNQQSSQASPAAFYNQSTPPNAMCFPQAAPPFNAPGNIPWWPQAMSGPMSAYPLDMFQQQVLHQMMNNQPAAMPFQCRLMLGDIPHKTRVETQIPIHFYLIGAPSSIKKLHLPQHTISKPKLLSKTPVTRSPDMLELYVQLVCTSAFQNETLRNKMMERAAQSDHPPLVPQGTTTEGQSEDDEYKPRNGGEVHICQGCMTREKKRANRKKNKKVDEEEIWARDEARRVVVFNTHEVMEWQVSNGPSSPPNSPPRGPALNIPPGSLEIKAPMRIACYCRHHGEKVGFHVIFTLKDWQSRVVAQQVSQSIMITDDHKTHPVPQQGGETSLAPGSTSALDHPREGSAIAEPHPMASAPPLSTPQPAPDLSTFQHAPSAPGSVNMQSPTAAPPAGGPSAPNLSRPASPSSSNGRASKKRKASGSRVPVTMSMTPLNTAPSPTAQSSGQVPLSASASPYSAAGMSNITGMNGLHQGPQDISLGQGPIGQNVQQPHPGAPTTPSHEGQPFFSNANRSASMDNLSMTAMFSAPPSAHASRAPSPNSLRQTMGAQPQNAMPQGMSGSMQFPATAGNAQAPPTRIHIHKIIPGEGPKMGGVEVTILGSGFTQGLDVYFGDNKATTTTFWGDMSLVCLLPPSQRAGPVPVTVRRFQGQYTPSQNQLFRYTDDEEAQLTKMMLGMISHKMTGQLLDVKELAQRIMSPHSGDWSGMGGGGDSQSGSGFAGNSYSMSTETQLLKCLELIDLDDSTRMPRLDTRKSNGQSMLHFGCSLGYHRFVAGLLARGANPDVRDKGGFTPMHLAALNNHETIVRRLIQAGADPTIRSLSGYRPADVAQSRKVIEHIRRCERHMRTRRRGSAHSRASSATSLKSLWDPRPVSDISDAVDDGEESPEYSSGDFEDDSDHQESWLDMRRRSTHAAATGARRPSMPHDHAELVEQPDSPTTALAQMSAQFHQLQQAFQLHFRQMPNLPRMQMPMLPDYHASLQQSLMERMSSLMPNMGSRPGSAGDDNSKSADGRWWDFLTPPPPYTETLGGQQDYDTKQASAAQAAAEAEADVKCATLYDTQTIQDESEQVEVEVKEEEEEEEEQEATSSRAPPVARALRIGRKKAMTKEQQQDFLRVHAEKFKGMSSDKNLWFVWIPLLTCILAAMMYIRFPAMFEKLLSALVSFSPFQRVPTQRIAEVV